MNSASPALELEGISKRFGRIEALSEVALRVESGQVHALLGENGAGKTTLMHVAFGMVSPDAGAIRMGGAPIGIASPSDAIARGIGMVHQHFTLVPAMTVAENLVLGGHGILRPAAMSAAVHAIAGTIGFALEPDARVETLTVAAQQRVEIAKALARRAHILILDEPTAVLAPTETADLLRWMRGFADAGHAVILITHKLHEALAIADSVTVLRQGRVVHAGAAADASASRLAEAMIGEEAARATEAEPGTSVAVKRESVVVTPTDVVFVARSVTVHDEQGRTRLRDASLVVHAGEIVGVAGLDGAGQHELLRALAGRTAIASGSVKRPPHVGFVPEDRHRDAVLLDRSLTDNMALRGAGKRRGRMPWRALRSQTRALMRDFDVRAPSAAAVMRTLSGGNQQKFVLAREMAEMAEMADHELARSEPARGFARSARQGLIVENPTRGLDVRASADVQSRLRVARDHGMAIVLYSSDLDEVLTLATRVVVLCGGALSEVPLDRAAVGRAMLGAA